MTQTEPAPAPTGTDPAPASADPAPDRTEQDGSNAQRALLDEVVSALEPVVLAAANEERRQALLDELGWDLGALVDMSPAQVDTWLRDVAKAITGVQALVEHPPQSLPDLLAALETVRAVVATARTFPKPVTDLPVDMVPAGRLAEDLITTVVVSWLERRHERLFRLLVLLGVVVLEIDRAPDAPLGVIPPPAGSTDPPRALRVGKARPQLRLSRLADLLRDPVATLKADYVPNGLGTDADAEDAARLLFGRIGAVLASFGVPNLVGLVGADGSGLDAATEALGATMLSLAVPLGVGTHSELGFTFGLSSAQSGDLGLVVVPRAAAGLRQPVGSWQVTGDLAAAGSGLAVGPQGVTLLTTTGEVVARIEMSTAPAPGEPAVRLGSTTGTRLEIGNLKAWVAGRLGGDRDDIEVGAEASDAALVVAPGDGDGFLRAVLPPGGLRTEFGLGLAWSRRQGVHVSGSAGLDATFPLHLRLGPLEIVTAHVALSTVTDGLRLSISGSARLALGPVTAAVEKIGIEAALTFTDKAAGNLGAAHLDVRFTPPAGVALAVDAGPVKGGGYLFLDPARGQYAGAMALEMQGIALKALGLLTTRMPDGSDGFSLLVVISAEFTPVQLGLGFTLMGVGGLIGINRTVAIETLRAGVRTHALDAVMFPKDPVGHATELVSALGALFPPAPGRHVIGPMARLGWGTPTLLTIDVGLLLELPAPVRMSLLGRLHMALPREEAALIVMNMDVLGVLDFERGEVSIDATLYDSRIAAFTLTGDMALRARWKGDPAFALSVGGFHPRFQPPPGFPALRRMTLSLVSGDNPRVRLESYLALTSNTLQFGARLDLYAQVPDVDLSLSGMLGFDALFTFDPFSFAVDIVGMVALKAGGRLLMAVGVAVRLTGPTPWTVAVNATFEILGVSGEYRVTRRFGSAQQAALPAAIDVAARLEEALADPRNWSTQLPPAGASVVTLRKVDPPPGQLIAHPLAGLSVSQRIVPLRVALARFGTAPVTDGAALDIAVLRVDSTAFDTTGSGVSAAREHFAGGQFLDLTDDEKLSRPSFERFVSGYALVDGVSFERERGTLIESPVDYLEITLGPPGTPAVRATAAAPMAPHTLAARTAAGPAATAATRNRFAGARLPIAVYDTGYRAGTGEPVARPGDRLTYVEAAQAEQATDPTDGGPRVLTDLGSAS